MLRRLLLVRLRAIILADKLCEIKADFMCGCTLKDSTSSTELLTYSTLFILCIMPNDRLARLLTVIPTNRCVIIIFGVSCFGRILVHFLCLEAVTYSEITKARSIIHHPRHNQQFDRRLRREMRVRRGIEPSTVRYS
jgi:hypothetical protein